MSNNTNPSIQTLPVEIFHHIFDKLDAQTILFSIRPVCLLFRAMVNSYDRYTFDFKSISKSTFHLLCRLINPQNVISLRLCDDENTPNQIGLFMPLVRLQQFNRLRSITFLGIEECQLNMILKRINLNFLTSFSLHIREYDNRRRKTTLYYLSSILAQPNLRNVELNIKNDRLSSLSWPVNSRVQYLIVNSDIIFDNMLAILLCSPQLHRKKLDVTIDQLESLLLLMPSLIYLKLIGGSTSEFDGKRWEQFIQANLPHLNNFEFFFGIYKSIRQTREDLEFIIDSFRSPFWIACKKWFVACQFNSNHSYRIQIYSIPICKSVLRYKLDSNDICLSSLTTLLNNDPSTMKNINEIQLSLESSTYGNMKTEKLPRINSMFPNVTKLNVNIGGQYPLDSLEFLTSVIDFSKLVEVKLGISDSNNNNQNLLVEIISILEQWYSLSSLIIHSDYDKHGLYPCLNKICSILPRQIKRLQMPVNQLDQIEIIVERCQNLSVVQFEITCLKISEEVIQWFNENTIDSTFRRRAGCDIIWIGQTINHINVSHKRIKLSEDQFDS